MLDIKRILITGDDGYVGAGTRALVSLLKNSYELEIAATLRQQSGVGGKIDLQSEKKWGKTEIEEVSTMWLDGSPADVMNVSSVYYHKSFDLIVSGINLGANIGYALISSGTFAAAVRGVGVGLAPRAIIMSWDTPSADFFREHNKNEDITKFLEYPGNMAKTMFDLCLENDMWGKPFVNINFPYKKTEDYKMTRASNSISRFYTYIVDIDQDKHIVSAPKDIAVEKNLRETDTRLDTGALNRGFISVTPMEFVG